MARKPATRHHDAVEALAAIPDATERAKAAGEMTDTMRETTPRVAAIRQQAIKELRAEGKSYREIGEALGIHFTRVRQIESGESTGKWKRAASKPTDVEP